MTTYYDGKVYVGHVSEPYWQAIPQEERDAIATGVPDGHRLVIVPGHRAQPGTADIGLRTKDNQTAGPVIRGYVNAQRCRAALRLSPERWDPGRGFIVTTDAAGWVDSIEERD